MERDLESCRPRRRLIITIDVEALPRRAPSDHVDRLIWGRFGGSELGIGRMMSIANRYNRPLTFFADLCEMPLYPGAFEEVAKAILAEGHDLQLHAHPDILASEFWTARKVTRAASSLSSFGREQASALFAFLTDSAVRLGQSRPVAFRGGAFRYNEAILAAMADYGVALGFNYKVKSTHQANNSANLPTFRWSNGITEFPMSLLECNGYLRAFEFSSTSAVNFGDLAGVQTYMNRYFADFGIDAVLVMLMHSWSLLYLAQETGYFEHRNDALAQQFDDFLAGLPSDVEVITAADAARLIEKGSFRPALERDVDLANRAKYGCAEVARTTDSVA
jgi:hypothetical protein